MSEQIFKIISMVIGVIFFGTFSYIGFFKPEIFEIPGKGGLWVRFIHDTPEKEAKRMKSYGRSAVTNLIMTLLLLFFIFKEIELLIMTLLMQP